MEQINTAEKHDKRYSDVMVMCFIYALYILVYGIRSIKDFFSSHEVLPVGAWDLFWTTFWVAVQFWIFVRFKGLLNTILKYHKADSFIWFFLIVNTITSYFLLFVVALIPKFDKMPTDLGAVVGGFSLLMIIVAMYIYGLSSLLLGLNLRQTPSKINILGILLIISGVLFFTCIGVFIDFFVETAIFIVLGLIFKEYSSLSTLDNKKNENDDPHPVNKDELKKEIIGEVVKEIKNELLKDKIKQTKSLNLTIEQKVDDVYNNLSLPEFNKIKEEVMKYMPTNLKDHETQAMIKDYIKRKLSEN